MVHDISLPESLNSTSLRALRGSLEAIDGGVVVLRGAQSGVYCYGLDLASLTEPADIEVALSDFVGCLLAVRAAPAPVLALVEGVALGGGLGLAAAADFIIAAESARFGLPEVALGLSPAMILPILEERVGVQRARRLALCPGTFDAERALSLGLIDEVVSSVEAVRARAIRQWRQVTSAGARGVKTHPHSFTACAAGVRAGRVITQRALNDVDVRARLVDFLGGGAPPWA